MFGTATSKTVSLPRLSEPEAPQKSKHSFYHQLTLKTHGVRRAGSAALDLCSVACGRYDGFWEFNLNPGIPRWRADCAGSRGTVTDFAGAEFDIASRQCGDEWPHSLFYVQSSPRFRRPRFEPCPVRRVRARPANSKPKPELAVLGTRVELIF